MNLIKYCVRGCAVKETGIKTLAMEDGRDKNKGYNRSFVCDGMGMNLFCRRLAGAGEDGGIPEFQGRAFVTVPWRGYIPSTIGFSGEADSIRAQTSFIYKF